MVIHNQGRCWCTQSAVPSEYTGVVGLLLAEGARATGHELATPGEQEDAGQAKAETVAVCGAGGAAGHGRPPCWSA